MKSVAIVGGGVSGLVAAWHLATTAPSWKITVFEADERVGGKLRQEEIAGHRVDVVDTGQHTDPELSSRLQGDLGLRPTVRFELPREPSARTGALHADAATAVRDFAPDVVLALGVVPVGMAAVEFGGNANKSTDWFDAKLAETPGAERPVTWSEAAGIDAEAIAATRPDLIVAAYSGITREDYDRLAKIAPTIAYPQDTPAFGTPWQETTRLIGTALGKDAEAEALVKDLEGKIADAAAKHTALKDATFIYGTVDPSAADQISLYTLADNRPRFLESLGMKQAPVVTENSPADQAFFFTWSPERADELESDVLVSWALDDSAAEKIAADPLLSRIPAVAKDALVLQTDQQQVLSVSAISPLSIPYALEHLVPPIADAAARAKKA